jgi:hypothetical protein
LFGREDMGQERHQACSRVVEKHPDVHFAMKDAFLATNAKANYPGPHWRRLLNDLTLLVKTMGHIHEVTNRSILEIFV